MLNSLDGEETSRTLQKTSDTWLFVWLAVLDVAVFRLFFMHGFPSNLNMKSIDEFSICLLIIAIVSFVFYIPSLIMSCRGSAVVFSGFTDYIASHGWLLAFVFRDYFLVHRYLFLIPIYSLLWMLFGGFRRWNSLLGSLVAIGGRTFAVLFAVLAVGGFLGKIDAEKEMRKKRKSGLGDQIPIIAMMALAALISFFYRKGIHPLYYSPNAIARMRNSFGFTNKAIPGFIIQTIVVAILSAVFFPIDTILEGGAKANDDFVGQDKQVLKECVSILDPKDIGEITPQRKEFLVKMRLFRDIMRHAAVPDEALKDSYASGGFEVFRDISTRDLENQLNDDYLLGNLADSLNKGLSRTDIPDWERHELKIRRCLDHFLPHSERLRSKIGDVMPWGDDDEILVSEAVEILRVLQSIQTSDGFLLNSSVDSPKTSTECAERIVMEQNCPVVAEKWIREMGKWTIAWGMLGNAPDSTPILMSPSFPAKEFLSGEKRHDETFVLDRPALLVLKNGKVHLLHSGHKYSWFELASETHGIQASSGIVFLSPNGMIRPCNR